MSDVSWMSLAVMSAGPAHVEAQGDRLVAVADEHDVLQVQDDVGDVFDHTADGVELVERVVEPHLCDRRTGDRRQEGAPQ